jgi:hypothetical protein
VRVVPGREPKPPLISGGYMDRRQFLKSLVGGIAAVTAVGTSFFRIFGFSKNTKIAKPYEFRPYHDIKPMKMPEIPQDIRYYLDGEQGILWKHHKGVQKTNVSFPISTEIENLDLPTMRMVETEDGVVIGDRYNTYRYRVVGEDQHWAKISN